MKIDLQELKERARNTRDPRERPAVPIYEEELDAIVREIEELRRVAEAAKALDGIAFDVDDPANRPVVQEFDAALAALEGGDGEA